MFEDHKFLLIGAGVAALALLILVKKKGAAAAVGQGLGTAAVDLAKGTVEGVTYGIGDTIGVPRTDMTACEQAKAAGSYWDASFACPAGDFLSFANPFK